MIYSPGHTAENYTFYWAREGVLFAADLLFHLRGSLITSPKMITWDTDAVKSSAKRVLDMEPAVICVGHGEAVKAPNAKIDALRATLK